MQAHGDGGGLTETGGWTEEILPSNPSPRMESRLHPNSTELLPDLPSFTPLVDPTFTWGLMDSESFSHSLNTACAEIYIGDVACVCRPHVEYCAAVWNPHLRKDVDAKRGSRWICCRWSKQNEVRQRFVCGGLGLSGERECLTLWVEKHGLIEEPLTGAVFESIARPTARTATNAVRV